MINFNKLTPAQTERLALLGEELCESGQIIGKILRHGYDSYNPYGHPEDTNRILLETELSHVFAALTLMFRSEDLLLDRIELQTEIKLHNVKQYLHHQPDDIFPD